jgi:hypothetical protein
MLPESPVSAKPKKAGLILGTMTSCGSAGWNLLSGPPPDAMSFVALACVVVGNAAVIFFGWPAVDGFLVREGRTGAGRTGGSPGRGLARGAGHAPASAGRRRVLRAVARLMPPAAGRRWLAEAESLLFEVARERRGKAARSYLLSAPRLLATMWAGELSRRARSRRRRPR